MLNRMTVVATVSLLAAFGCGTPEPGSLSRRGRIASFAEEAPHTFQRDRLRCVAIPSADGASLKQGVVNGLLCRVGDGDEKRRQLRIRKGRSAGARVRLNAEGAEAQRAAEEKTILTFPSWSSPCPLQC